MSSIEVSLLVLLVLMLGVLWLSRHRSVKHPFPTTSGSPDPFEGVRFDDIRDAEALRRLSQESAASTAQRASIEREAWAVSRGAEILVHAATKARREGVNLNGSDYFSGPHNSLLVGEVGLVDSDSYYGFKHRYYLDLGGRHGWHVGSSDSGRDVTARLSMQSLALGVAPTNVPFDPDSAEREFVANLQRYLATAVERHVRGA